MTPGPSRKRFSLGQRVTLAIVPRLVALLMRAIGSTLRFTYVLEPGVIPPTVAIPGIYCFWHQCALPSLLYFKGKLRCSILVSQSFDGELIARTIEQFGFDAVRGSSSREGAAGLLGLKHAIEAGFNRSLYGRWAARAALQNQTRPGQAGADDADAGRHSVSLAGAKMDSEFVGSVPFTRVAVSWGARGCSPSPGCDQ